MLDIIIAFPKMENGKTIKSMLIRNGIPVNAVVSSGKAAIALANELDGGIVICGYRFSDMHCRKLWEYLPIEFEMLLVASPARLEDAPANTVCLAMPIKANELIGTVEMMARSRQKQRARIKEKSLPFRERNKEEKVIIQNAKILLMERNNMTEEEAHRYLQKTSMDSGMNLVETARIILDGR